MTKETGNILVVDDVEANRDMLSRRLARRGYHVETAAGGREALDRIGEEQFDAILLDIMMPEMDGYQVLEAIRKDHASEALPVIMVTAKDESEDVVRALELGANDYVTKPVDLAVCMARLRTQLKLKESSEALRKANERMTADLDAAAKVQQALLPSTLPKFTGAQFAWVYEPCDQLGGDILNVFALDEDHVAFYLLDVSGHGVPAALLSVTLSRVLMPHRDHTSLLSRPVRTGGPVHTTDDKKPVLPYAITPPVEVARRLNKQFPMDPKTLQYFTLFYGMIDLKTRQLQYVSAGHPGPVCFRAGSNVPEVFAQASPPIGWFQDAEYEEQTLDLQPGDRFYVWSDGIIEAMNAERELFGGDRLLACLVDRLADPVTAGLDAVVASVQKWSEDVPQDDISIVCMQID